MSSDQQVALFVQGQVVGAGEAAVTVRALEGLHSCVLAEVARQLIGAGKLPRTALPHAPVGLLTWGRKGDRRMEEWRDGVVKGQKDGGDGWMRRENNKRDKYHNGGMEQT